MSHALQASDQVKRPRQGTMAAGSKDVRETHGSQFATPLRDGVPMLFLVLGLSSPIVAPGGIAGASEV